MKKLSVDRFEEDTAICEDEAGNAFEINLKKLPQNVFEGSIIKIEKSGKINLDEEETAKRKSEILKLREKVHQKSDFDKNN